MNVEVDLNETQMCEPAGKKWKQDDVAKDMLTSCADEAASKAAKELLVQMANDAEKREADRLASDADMRDRRMVERLDDVVKRISESLHGRKTILEAKMQNQ